MAEFITSSFVTSTEMSSYFHDRPAMTRSLTCPGAISRNRWDDGLPAGLHRRCRSEGGCLSNPRPSFFGLTASSFSDSEGDGTRKAAAPSLPPSAKTVRFSAEPAVVQTKRTNEAPTWGITGDMLRAVPPNYPILKPSAKFSGLRAETIAARISEFFRLNSIHAQYHHAKAEVQATTSDGIEFAIALWKADGEGGVIMEAQRHGGSSPAFHRIYRDLYRAVRDGEYTTRQTVEEEVGAYNTSTYNISYPTCDTEGGYPNQDANLLVLVSEMIRCEMIETKELGLQSLQFLVTSEKAGSKRALDVANAIVQGRTDQGSDIRNDLFAILLGGSVNEEGSGNLIRGCIENRGARLRTIALQILARMLGTIAGDKNSSMAYQTQITSQYWERLIPALVMDVENATYQPHDAVRAIEALRGFVALSSRGRETALRCGLEPLLIDAREYGHSQYQSLETKSMSLMSALLT